METRLLIMLRQDKIRQFAMLGTATVPARHSMVSLLCMYISIHICQMHTGSVCKNIKISCRMHLKISRVMMNLRMRDAGLIQV